MIVKTKVYRSFEKKDRINFNVFLARKNMKAVNFCRKIGISQSYLQAILNGQRPLTDKMLERFKHAGFDPESE